MKTLLQFIGALCLTIATNTSVFGTTIYCSPTGNDNAGNGSLMSPYRNLEFAIGIANQGDVIELRAGNYPSDEIRISISNLTIRSYAGEHAVITCPTNVPDATSCIWYDEPDVNGGLLEDLEIVGGYLYGIKLESNWDWGMATRYGVKNITIRRCNIHHTGRDCIKITPGCDHINIESCEIHHSGIGPANQPDPNAEGIDNVNGSNMWVHNCYFHDISTNAVYAKGGAKDCMIEENLVMNTGEAGILLGFYTDAEWFDEVNNPQYFECLNSTMRNNIVLNTGGAGIGFFGTKNCAAYHNTVQTASPTFHTPLFFNVGEIWISDNLTLNPANENVSVRNNIFIDQSPVSDDDLTVQVRENSLSGTWDINYNCFYKTTGAASFDDGVTYPPMTLTQWQMNLNMETNGMEMNPNLNGNYHLMAGSPCINAGSNFSTNLRDYDGGIRNNTPDIGADEFQQGINTTCPPTSGTIGTGVAALTTSLSPISNDIQAKVFPNPTPDQITLSLSTPQVLDLLEVYNISGEKCKTIPILTQQTTLSLKDLPAGIYFLFGSKNGKKQWEKSIFKI